MGVAPASDVFSLGAVLYYAAVGRGPFGTGTAHALLYRVVHDQPDLTGLPAELAAVIEQCLAKLPHHRPSPGALLASLTYGAATPAPTMPVGAGHGPLWWEQTTVTARPAHPPPTSPAGPQVALAADAASGADTTWWSAGGLSMLEEPEPTSPARAFPVGQEALAVYRERHQVRDRGRAPGPRVGEPLVPGDVVEHAKFGTGTVLEIRDSAYVLIAFGPRQIEHAINVRIAPMQKISAS